MTAIHRMSAIGFLVVVLVVLATYLLLPHPPVANPDSSTALPNTQPIQEKPLPTTGEGGAHPFSAKPPGTPAIRVSRPHDTYPGISTSPETTFTSQGRAVAGDPSQTTSWQPTEETSKPGTIKPDGHSEQTATEDASSSDPIYPTIGGWVKNQDGEAMAGIKVTITQRHTSSSQTTSTDQSLVTSEDGAFRFTLLTDGEHLVFTNSTQNHSGTRTFVHSGNNNIILVVQEHSAATNNIYVHGTVSSVYGLPLNNVTVRPVSSKNGKPTHTDPAGLYGIDLTTHSKTESPSLRFSLPGFIDKMITLTDADHDAMGTALINVQLTPADQLVSLAGHVSDSIGIAVANADIKLFSAQLKRSYRTKSTASGAFSFSDIEAGSDYQLTAQAEGTHQKHTKNHLNLTHGNTSLSIILEPLAFTKLAGQIVTLDGTPVPKFNIWFRSTNANHQPYRQVVSNDNGQFSINELPLGEVNFRTRTIPHISVSGISIKQTPVQTVQLTVDHGAYTASGHVLDTMGNPVPGAEVTLLWTHIRGNTTSRSTHKTISDSGGNFSFAYLGPGTRTLLIKKSGYQAARISYEANTKGLPIKVTLLEAS